MKAGSGFVMQRVSSARKAHYYLAASAIPAALVLTNIQASAQEAVQVMEAENSAGVATAVSDAKDIIVTGTRVSRQGYDAPTPTTVLDASRIEESATPNIADFVVQLPALMGSNTPRRGTSGAGQEAGSNFFDMRSLGPNRTLVLLDGHRVVPSSTIGAVDANLLPQAIIQRVDVITGGASAAWGSDAVAGVVNYIIDKKFSGVKAGLQYGISDEGDAKAFKAELAIGSSFADGRGHIIVSGEYHSEGGVSPATARNWYRGRKTVLNPAWTPTNGQPRRISIDHVGKSNQSRGGLITGPKTITVGGAQVANPLYNMQFRPDGELTPYNVGTITGVQAFGGDADDVSDALTLALPLRFGNAYSRVSFDVRPNITVYGEASYAKARNDVVGRIFEANNVSLSIENPYLPDAVRTQMTDLGLDGIKLGRMFLDLGGMTGSSKRSQQRYVIGAEGSFGKGWTWDAYFQHGRTHFTFGDFVNDPILANFDRAVDAVRDPGTGEIVCRSTLTDPDNFCSPMNIIGENNMSADSLAYIYGRSVQMTKFGQDVAAATLRGDPFSTWAGPVSIAIGGEYRREKYNSVGDALSQYDAFWIGNYASARGKYNVKEAFFETVVPLLDGVPFFQHVDLNGAVRYTDYSTSGSVTTWKVGATWDVSNELRLRGVVSRDIRAANLSEQFAAGTTLNQTIDDPLTGTSYSTRTSILGNPAVDPERADTKSIGLVYRPHWVPGFSLSIDYYDIKIKDAIATLEAINIIDRCQAGDRDLCQYITRDPTTGLISSMELKPINLNSEHARGVDIEASWRTDIDGLGTLALRSVATYADKRSISSNGITVNYAGDNANEQRFPTAVPRWKVLTSATLESGRFSTTLTNRFISAGAVHKTFVEGVDINVNKVKAIAYFDLSATYRLEGIGKETALFASVQNLLDTDPPASPNWSTSSTLQTGVNGYLYDIIGRQFRFGLRTKF